MILTLEYLQECAQNPIITEFFLSHYNLNLSTILDINARIEIIRDTVGQYERRYNLGLFNNANTIAEMAISDYYNLEDEGAVYNFRLVEISRSYIDQDYYLEYEDIEDNSGLIEICGSSLRYTRRHYERTSSLLNNVRNFTRRDNITGIIPRPVGPTRTIDRINRDR
jgi:hypothetical protein